MGRSLRVEADGGSRGNPGVAGYGALVRDAETGEVLVELAAPLGTASNNVAEYRGMLAGLRVAQAIDPAAEVEVGMDSKLVVEQMSGRWKIKHPDMQELARQGRDLVAEITAAGGSVAFVWMPRDANAHADALSNRGMDGEEVEEWREGSRGDHPPRRDTEPAAAQRRPGRDGPTLVVLALSNRGMDGEQVEDWHGTQSPRDDRTPRQEAEPVTVQPGDGATRVVLVHDGSREEAERAAAQVAVLVDDPDASVITSDLVRARRTGATIAERLEVVPEVDADWDGPSEGESYDEVAARVVPAWDRAVSRGATVVIVCPRSSILVVLAHVLGVPPERVGRLIVAPGSLTAIEARPDGEAVVAFTNRT